MGTPAPASAELSVGDAFGYVFRSPGWFGKLLIGAVCLIFSFLLIPAWIVLGYMIETSRTVRGGRHELPPWQNVGQMLVDGLLLSIATLIWLIPGYVLLGIGYATMGCTSSAGVSTCTGSFGAVGYLGVLYFLAVALLYPAIYSEFLARGIGGAFNVSGVLARFQARPGAAIVAIIMAVVAGIIALFGLILLVIGVVFTVMWAYMVQASLYGQFARLTDPAVGGPPSGP
ncbi:MAG TPA: DUF4013 domain-containing protein [Candidatus Limnocylindrales bacterium]|nr:DUF4013 domain-containing protein [Candidatus Limnocylindrales bacterium]